MIASGITKAFNLTLFGYLLVATFLQVFFDSSTQERSLFDEFADASPGLAIAIAIAAAIVFMLAGAQLSKTFWNRLITDLTQLRDLTFQEAMSILLIVWLLGSWFNVG